MDNKNVLLVLTIVNIILWSWSGSIIYRDIKSEQCKKIKEPKWEIIVIILATISFFTSCFYMVHQSPKDEFPLMAISSLLLMSALWADTGITIDKLINRYKCVYVNNNFIMDTIAGIFTLSVTGNYFYNLLK